MKFSFLAFSATVMLVVASGIASFFEGTFTSKKVTMGFVNHGGMWGDLVIMSVVTGFVGAYFTRNRLIIGTSVLLALTLTLIIHAQWGNLMRKDNFFEHMFGIQKTGKWYTELTIAGWLHVAVMTGLLTVVFVYTASAIPPQIVLIVSTLLSLHVFLGTVQPGWYCTRSLWTWRNFAPPLFASALIWTIAILKLKLSKTT